MFYLKFILEDTLGGTWKRKKWLINKKIYMKELWLI